MSARITRNFAKAIWLHAQRLDSDAPFGRGPPATPAAVSHLGYVQIDTIHVIEHVAGNSYRSISKVPVHVSTGRGRKRSR